MKNKTKKNFRNAVKRHRKFYQILDTVFLVFTAAILVVNLLKPAREYSSNENRNLAQRPEMSGTALTGGGFFQDFDSYYSDQFAGRDLWMSVRNLWGIVLGNRESNSVLFGQDGYLIQYPVTPNEEAETNLAAAMNTFASTYPDIPQTLILVPDAAAILENKLPANAPVRDQNADIAEFENRLDDSIQKADAVATLQSASAEQQVYYRTDHHWTSDGAYSVFQQSADLLGLNSLPSYTERTVTDSFQGTLSSKSGRYSQKDSIEIYEPEDSGISYYVKYPDTGTTSRSIYVSEKLGEKDKYQVFFGGNHPLVEIRTTANNQRNLLVFKDSYANSFIQFLIPFYEKIILVDPRYYYDNIDTALTTYGITDILYLYSADTLLIDTNLTDTLLSGVESTSSEVTEEVEETQNQTSESTSDTESVDAENTVSESVSNDAENIVSFRDADEAAEIDTSAE